jgi:hypothetical protein
MVRTSISKEDLFSFKKAEPGADTSVNEKRAGSVFCDSFLYGNGYRTTIVSANCAQTFCVFPVVVFYTGRFPFDRSYFLSAGRNLLP